MFYYRLGEITDLPYFCVGAATGVGKTTVFSEYKDHFFIRSRILFIEVDEKSHCTLLKRKTFLSLITHMEETSAPKFASQGIRAICFCGHMRPEDVCGYIFSSKEGLAEELSILRGKRVDPTWLNPYSDVPVQHYDVHISGYDWISWLIKNIKDSLDEH